MKTFATIVLATALLCIAPAVYAAELPKLPEPAKEHAWLQQLVGEWEFEGEIFLEPGKPVKSTGTESVRALGGYWIVAESRSSILGLTFTGVMTLGYDPEKKKYIGTWIDSMASYLWKYEGTVDAGGKTLTLETEGPSPLDPAKLSKFKEVIDLKDKDRKIFTSSMQGADGKWDLMMTYTYQRKK